MENIPWLSALIWVPFLGMLAVAALGKTKEMCRMISLVTSVVTFGISMLALNSYLGAAHGQVIIGGTDPSTAALFQSVLFEDASWFSIAGLDVRYTLDVDGLSMLLIVLTGLILVVASIASWNIDKSPRGYHSMLMLLLCAMMGTFVSMDLFLFYVFWELMLLPMYFLIGIWGGPRREYAAIKFFVYTLVGSVLMLGAFLAIYFDRGTLNIPALVADSALIFEGQGTVRTVLFFAMFIGFAIKVPVFPFHTWLPDAHVEAPTPISVILAAVLLKMGGYGLLRMAWPMFPEVIIEQGSVLAGLAVISIVYGALVAMAQTDWKKLVAYSSVSHMGYVLLGMTALTAEGVGGGIFQMFNHGTISGMMFLLVGVMYERVHHRDLNRFGGLMGILPKYSVMAMIGFFAALGLPGTSGFVSEIMIFLGAFKSEVMPHAKVFTILGTLGIVFGAVYILTMIQRVFLGTPKELGDGHSAHDGHDDGHGHDASEADTGEADPHAEEAHGDDDGHGGGHDEYHPPKAPWPDLTMQEWATLLPLAAITIFLGIYPKIALDFFNPTVLALLEKMKVAV
ncbi:MAG: complex I subunit 4 family protein [Planctomycetota bacterium]|jgi:NADH-quinone oxidoreductase subunit M